MRQSIIFTIIVILLSGFITNSCLDRLINPNNKKQLDKFNYLPESTIGKTYIREAYSFSYVEAFEQAQWVAYYIDQKDLQFRHKKIRRPFFSQDPMVETQSAHWKNFKNSGYDKGHLCPAAIRKKSAALYKETFYTSNVSPQLHSFNGKIWNRLEQKIRQWVNNNNGVYVITGPVLKNDLPTIGAEKVIVPSHFYKVILSNDLSKMIAFLLPHNDNIENYPLKSFVISTDKLEKLTAIDFYPQLNDSLESKLEKSSNWHDWF